MVGVVAERNGGRALRDRVGHVEGGVADAAARAGRHVAVAVVAVARIADAVHRACDRRDRVRPRAGAAAGAGIAIGPDVGLAGDVADRVVGDGLGGYAAAGGNVRGRWEPSLLTTLLYRCR